MAETGQGEGRNALFYVWLHSFERAFPNRVTPESISMARAAYALGIASQLAPAERHASRLREKYDELCSLVNNEVIRLKLAEKKLRECGIEWDGKTYVVNRCR